MAAAARASLAQQRNGLAVCARRPATRAVPRPALQRVCASTAAAASPPALTPEAAAAKVAAAAVALGPAFADVDRITAANLRRTLTAFADARLGTHHLAGSTGYGHADLGRDAIDDVFARLLGAESACARVHFHSGTHAIACALYGCLRPGDELLAVAGHPYDTLEEVIGLRGTPGAGSLAEWGVTYRELPLATDGCLDWEALASAVRPETRVALLQRSCGYTLRPSLGLEEIRRAAALIKAQSPRCVVFVDNCYGELVEDGEPTSVGADLMAGSLIKNLGGTIAPCGGYVAGKEDLVLSAVARLSAPGIGKEAGAVPGDSNRLICQGLFLAPGVVGEAVKGGLLVAEVMSREGYEVWPPPGSTRHDIITAVKLGSRERVLAFARAVQKCGPVGAYIEPTAGATSGYASEVVFADGTFIDGSTLELSADGPLRKPFAIFCQGGTHWTHWAYVLETALLYLDNPEASGVRSSWS